MPNHCGTCSCGTIEYGIKLVSGVDAGKIMAPLSTDAIGFWNRHRPFDARLVIRVRPNIGWNLATDDEIDYWNKKVLTPFVLRR
jgi:hypothetical protein